VNDPPSAANDAKSTDEDTTLNFPVFFFKQKTAYELGLGIPAEPLFRSHLSEVIYVPNPDEAVPSFVSGAMAKAGKGLLEGTLQAGTSAVSDKLLDLVGLGGKSAADKGKRSEERRVGKECRSRWSAYH